jgi:hypothetical protein
MVHRLRSLLVLFSLAIGAAEDGMKITVATYGSNCQGKRKAALFQEEVVAVFFENCYGKEECSFKFDHMKAGGDPFPGCSKQCTVDFACGDVKHHYSSPSKRECDSTIINLSCANPDTVVREVVEDPGAIDDPTIAAEIAAEEAQANAQIVAQAEALEKANVVAQDELSVATKAAKIARIAAMEAAENSNPTPDEELAKEIADLDLAAAEAGLEAAEAVAEAAVIDAGTATLKAADLRASGVTATAAHSSDAGGPPFRIGNDDENCPADYVWILDLSTCREAGQHFGFGFNITDTTAPLDSDDEETTVSKCRKLVAGHATVSDSHHFGGEQSQVLCQMDPRKVTIKTATYGENCMKDTRYEYDAELGFEAGVFDYFKEQCYNSSIRAWKQRCSFDFSVSNVGNDPAPGCPKTCFVSWICGFNETRAYPFPRGGGDCSGATININCDERPEEMERKAKEQEFLYMLGGKGAEMCPKGFARVMDEESCEAASKFFKLEYKPDAMNHDGRDAFVCRTWGAGKSTSTRMSSKYGRNSKWICSYDVFGEMMADTTSAKPTGNTGWDLSHIEVWAEGVKLVTAASKNERARQKAAGEKNKVLTLANTDADGGDCSYRCAGLQHQAEKQTDTCNYLVTHQGQIAAAPACEVGYETGYFVSCYQLCKNETEAVNRRILKKYLNTRDSICGMYKGKDGVLGCGSGFVAGVDASAVEQQHRIRAKKWVALNKKVGNKVRAPVLNATAEERVEWEPTEEEPLSPEDQEQENACGKKEAECSRQANQCNQSQTECKQNMKSECRTKGVSCQKYQSRCLQQQVRCQSQEDECDIEREMCEQDREIRGAMTRAAKEVEWLDLQEDAGFRRIEWLKDEGQMQRLMRLFVVWDQLQWVQIDDQQSRDKKLDRLQRVRDLRELKKEREAAKVKAEAKANGGEEPLVVAVSELEADNGEL